MTQDPDQIRADIERTRAELSADVDTLNEKVNPKYVAQRKTEQVKGRARGVKDKVMGAMPESGSSSGGPGVGDRASSAMSSVGGAASSVGDAASAAPDQVVQRAQGNPLAAGLIAFGAGWLASSLLPATNVEQRAAVQLKEHASDLAQPVTQQAKAAAQDVADNLKGSAQQAVESVKSTAQDAADNVKGEAQSAKDDVASQAQESKQNVQSQSGSGSGSSSTDSGSYGGTGTLGTTGTGTTGTGSGTTGTGTTGSGGAY